MTWQDCQNYFEGHYHLAECGRLATGYDGQEAPKLVIATVFSVSRSRILASEVVPEA